ncbi:DUF1343 domain-containing protein [Candidatus Dependentiae bacterium]|nr:DUF1343 domain-containing protein [Candidatus Dependentiae bacterium]
MSEIIKNGVDNYLEKITYKKKKYCAGIVCNQASVTQDLKYSHIELNKKLKIKYLFSPQHGFYCTEQANMIETPNSIDNLTGINLVSLYSSTRKINDRYLKNIDFIIFDLQDVGSRYYTYLWTLYYCMEACEKNGKKILVLDRPNIINGIDIEGNTISEGYNSFVGLFPILNRYGLTIGEFAIMLKNLKFKKLELEVVKLKNWSREKYFDEYKNEWIPASPNIPSITSAVTYPGTCLFEATNISEGRGTTRPFEIIGAPFINPAELLKEINRFKLGGVCFRQIYFRPTFDKFKNEICGGLFFHVIDRKKFKPVRTALILIYLLKKLYPEKFEWYSGAYEYENKIPAIDILYGSDLFRKCVDNQNVLKNIFSKINIEEKNFFDENRKWRIYK